VGCKFCKNVVLVPPLCAKHHEIFERVKEGAASPTLSEIYSSQEREDCYVPVNATVLFGYTKVPIIQLAFFFAGLPYKKGVRYIRTCGTKHCHNSKHLVAGVQRSPDETTQELRLHKDKINKLIRDTTFELCCIPGPVVQDATKIWSYYDNRRILLGTVLLNYHVGQQSGTAIRLCDTYNCYNQLHYKWGIATDTEKIRKKRLLFNKPDIPPEIEWQMWNKYKKLKAEDITTPIILSTLAKVYKTTADVIQAAIAWSKYR